MMEEKMRSDFEDSPTRMNQMADIQTARQRHAAYYQTVLATADDLYLQGGDGVLRGLALFDRREPGFADRFHMSLVS